MKLHKKIGNMPMSPKREIILRLICDISLIAFAIANTAMGKYLSDRIPLMAIGFCVIALIYLIVGIIDLHQTISILEIIFKKEKR